MRLTYYKPLKLPMIQISTLVTSKIKTLKNKQHVATPVDDCEPNQSIINNILNFSKSLSIKKSNTIGFIEVVAS